MAFYIDFGPQNDPKIIEKSMKNTDFSLFLIKILIIFRIDVRTRNFEVLGRILASISASIWDQVGPQSGSKRDLGASSTGFGKIFRKYVA